MLRLPADLQLRILCLAGAGEACSLTCRALRQTLSSPDSIIRLHLASYAPHKLPELLVVYCLLRNNRLRTLAQSEDGFIAAVQTLLECGGILKLFDQQQLDALKALQSADSKACPSSSVQLLQTHLPFAKHCLLPFCAQAGHVKLVKALLPITHAPVLVEPVVHYVKTSAFLAAAAGGQTAVLFELLSANATSWACQLPGVSLTRTALDLAAQGGHLEAMQLLKQHVGQPNSSFLSAAADSGNGAAVDWALGFWFGQFNAVTPFGPPHVRQMHDALRVACQRGHLAVIRQLLRYLHAVRCHDCCVLALSYTCSTSNTESMRCVLESPYLPQQLDRGGPRLLQQLVMVVASCLRIAIRIHSKPSLQLLLDHLSSGTSALTAVRLLLGPQMPSVFDEAATAGDTLAIQLLLMHLPELYEGLGFSALEAALSEGHNSTAQAIRALLIMRGPDQGFTAAALSPERNSNIAKAARHGAFKVASSNGDVQRLQQLLQEGTEPPSESEQLLILRTAAAAGREEAVQMALHEFAGAAGDGGNLLDWCLSAVCRGAVHAGQLTLLKSLAAGPSSGLVHHLTQPEALCEYLRAALMCGQVPVAAWLVQLAAEQQQLRAVNSTLHSLLTTSRWELWNIGTGKTAWQAVTDLFKSLAEQSTAAAAASIRCRGSSTTASAQPAAATQFDVGSNSSSGIPEQGIVAGDGSTTAAVATGPAALTADQAAVLLTPDLLGLLLHASVGDPVMLFNVVSAVSGLGLTSKQQQQQQQAKQLAPQGAHSSMEDLVTDTIGSGSSRALSAAASAATTVDSASSSSVTDVPATTGRQLLRKQSSRLGSQGSAAGDQPGFSVSNGSPSQGMGLGLGSRLSPAGPSGSEPSRLHRHPSSSWNTGVLRPAVSDPETFRSLTDEGFWRDPGFEPRCKQRDFGMPWLNSKVNGADSGAVDSGSGSGSSSRERLVWERLHGALSEPLSEVLGQAPITKAGRISQHGQQQQQQGLQALKMIEQSQQQQKRSLQDSQQQVAAVHAMQQQQSPGVHQLLQQQHSSSSGASAVRRLNQITGKVQQLSVSTPTSPQHPYMVQSKQQQQLLQQHQSLKRTSLEYGTRQQQLQQRQSRSVASLPAARIVVPQHPYMQNYQQQLQQQRQGVVSTGGASSPP